MRKRSMSQAKYLSSSSNSLPWYKMAKSRLTPASTFASKHIFAKCSAWVRSPQHQAFDRASWSFCDAFCMAIILEGNVLCATHVWWACSLILEISKVRTELPKLGVTILQVRKSLLVLWFIEGDFNRTAQAADSFSKRFVLGREIELELARGAGERSDC